MKKAVLTLTILLVFVATSFTQTGQDKRFSLSLTGGFALTQMDDTSNYRLTWDYYAREITEDNSFNIKAESGVSFSGFFSFLFSPNFGLQLGFGYLQPTVNTETDFRLTYNDTTESVTWPGDGKLSVIPLSLNLLGRYQKGNLGLFASGGATLFMNTFSANTFSGIGIASRTSWIYCYWVWPYIYCYYIYTYYIDALKIPIRINEESWTAFGGNIGGGIDYRFTESVGIILEARYFFCPEKTFDWDWQAGVYDSVIYEYFTGVNFTEAYAELYEEDTTAVTVNPSFFQFSIGIIIFF